MSGVEYCFVTRWHVRATLDELGALLQDLAWSLPEWWPAVYLDLTVLDPGDPCGLGASASLHTRGWLPYTLRWSFRVIESEIPHRVKLEAWGDLNGLGVFNFEQIGELVRITYRWQVRVTTPLLRALSFLARPILCANHRWAMARGEESLQQQLARRRKASARPPANADSDPDCTNKPANRDGFLHLRGTPVRGSAAG